MEAWTIAQWAREVGGDRHEWQKRVAAAEIAPVGESTGKASGGKTYRVRDLFNVAVGGDIERERLRKTKEEADKLALGNAKMRGELVEIEVVKRLGERVFVALRNRILNLPLLDEEKDKCLREILALGEIDWSK